MYCMFGVHRELQPNRFQILKDTHPAIWDYCMKPVEEGGLGLRDILEYIWVNSEQYKRGISLFDKINIRSYNIRKGVDNMEKGKYDLLIENNGFKLVKGGTKE